MSILHKLLGSLRALLKIVLAIVGLIILLPLGMMLIGYRINANSGDLAEEAAKVRDVSLCARIVNYGILGPSTGESRSHCVFRYAKITHDPSVCKLLMPSRYGLDCVGVATEDDHCSMNKRTVSWREGGNRIEEPYIDCKKGDPTRSKQGTQCCYIALVTFLRFVNDCSSLEGDQAMFDECQHKLAFKNHDPFSCSSIQDSNIRSACVVETEALRKDPTICEGCTPPVDRIEDLQ